MRNIPDRFPLQTTLAPHIGRAPDWPRASYLQPGDEVDEDPLSQHDEIVEYLAEMTAQLNSIRFWVMVMGMTGMLIFAGLLSWW